jgi:excisionase family DNA binding protein
MQVSTEPTAAERRSQYLTLAEAARHIHVSRRTIERWVQQGVLPIAKLGRLVRLSRAALDQYVAAHVGFHTTAPARAATARKKR